MTHRDRLLAALEHKKTDRVPYDLGSSNVSTIHKRAYENLIEQLGIEDKEIRMMDKAQQLVIPCEELLRKLDIDTRGVFLSHPKENKSTIISENEFIDVFGVTQTRPEEGLYFDVSNSPLANAETLEEVMEYKFPSVDDIASNDGVYERAKYLHENTDYAIVGNFGSSIFMKVQQIRGYSETLMDMAADEDIANYLLDKVLDLRIALVGKLIDACGEYLDIIEMADDIAGQNAPIISVDMYREMIKPRTKKLISYIKSRCNAKVLYHSCGDVYTLIDEFIDAGIDILNPIQVSAGNMSDIKRLKEKYGDKISFWGGICSTNVLPVGNPVDVRKAVEKSIEILGEGGGYVLCGSHNIQPDVTPENTFSIYHKDNNYYYNKLTFAGVDKYCEKSLVSFKDVFMAKEHYGTSDKYNSYSFEVWNNPTEGLKGGQVVYIVPPEKTPEFFEAFYQIDDIFYHRILSKKSSETCDGEVFIASDDKFHPVTVRGKNWFYYDDKCPIPMKLR